VETLVEQEVSESEMISLRWKAPIVKSRIFQCFLQWCKDSNSKPDRTEVSFWKELHAVLKPNKQATSLIQEKRRIAAKGDLQSKGQETVVCFPSLESCRQLFRDNVVHEKSWSFDQQGECTAAVNQVVTDSELGLNVFLN
jgi:hypothetical protein